MRGVRGRAGCRLSGGARAWGVSSGDRGCWQPCAFTSSRENLLRTLGHSGGHVSQVESGTMSAPGGGRGRSLTPAPPAPFCCPQRAACPFSPLEDLALLGCQSRQEREWVLVLSPAPGRLDHPLKAPTEPTEWDPQERPPGAQRPRPGPGQPSLHLLTPWPALPPFDSARVHS